MQKTTLDLFDENGFYNKKLFLNQNNIFCFGSNLAGKHGAGAAYFAYMHCDAIYGRGVGLQGNAYALPTKDENIKTLSLKRIENFVREFFYVVEENPNLNFFLTAIGTGLAGYTPEQIAPMFKTASNINNIYLPSEFWDIINKQ